MRINIKRELTIFLGVQILLLSLLKRYPEFVEYYYSNGIYVYISRFMRFAFGWIPFSMGDILYTLATIYALRWLIINRKRIINDTINWFLDIGAALSVAYLAFHILWAFNYYRQPLHKSLHIKADYTTEALISFTKQLINRSNAIHNKIVDDDTLKVTIPYSKTDIFNKIEDGFNRLSQKYPHLKYYPKSIKKSVYSTPLIYMGFSGYLNPFTNEGQVASLLPTYKYPTTSCHEAAHQLGYAAENEANFIGSLAAIHNDDIYFKYAGYTFALRYCLAEIYNQDQEAYYTILDTVNPGIIKNYQEVQNFWLGYKNPFEPYFEKTFDSFLKANNQSAGMKTYSYVVALFVNYYDVHKL
ncbi:MAG: DUF3810 domain-containing protein [Winogradskyella sp.]|uniref:DUF3810 domain-containing protein n=1 Tax=Winogradskyella sp. TaxID=1883156 RepID=UPI0018116000|nr:DUF3810 domain-containing protein [Winogradskyella sp.]